MKEKYLKVKRKSIGDLLIYFYSSIGMDKPHNHEEILDFVYNDVNEAADNLNWNDSDVAIGFRRWIEAQSENQP